MIPLTQHIKETICVHLDLAQIWVVESGHNKCDVSKLSRFVSPLLTKLMFRKSLISAVVVLTEAEACTHSIKSQRAKQPPNMKLNFQFRTVWHFVPALDFQQVDNIYLCSWLFNTLALLAEYIAHGSLHLFVAFHFYCRPVNWNVLCVEISFSFVEDFDAMLWRWFII